MFRILAALVWLFSIGLIAVGTWSSYAADLRHDQYQLINLGQCVYDGGRMYVDCWENKPPGIAWINALGLTLTGGRMIGAWLLPGVMALMCVILFGWATRRVLGAVASIASVLLASVTYTLRVYDTPSINPDFYSSMFELAAGSLWLVSFSAASNGRRVGLALLAGLLWSAATTVKHTGCLGLLAVTIVTLIVVGLKRPDRRTWVLAAGPAWAGFVGGIAVVVGILAYRQTLGLAWEAMFTFNRGLFSWSALGGALASWARLGADLEPVQLAAWLAALGAVGAFCVRKTEGMSPAMATALVLWWVTQVPFALLGPSKAMRYWQATWPAMLWLAGTGIFHIESLLRQAGKGYRAVPAILSATVVLFLAEPLIAYYQYGLATSYLTFTGSDTQRERLVHIGRRLTDTVPEPEPIYVWAYDVGVYLYAGRRPAIRFTYPRSDEQMEEILAGLETRIAYAIVTTDGPSPAFDAWCDDRCRDRLDAVLVGYEKRETVGNYTVWVRQGREGILGPAT